MMCFCLGILVFSFIYGTVFAEDSLPIYIPKQMSQSENEEPSREDGRYCYRFTWLGAKYDNNTFYEVNNKTCKDYADIGQILCVDPMVVTFSGRKPDLAFLRKHYFREATCKLSEDRVCAKYTIYYNGVASHVVSFCTRIDVESEGPLLSGCLTEKNGSSAYEICACISGHGEGGICNSSTRNDSYIIMQLVLFALPLLLYKCEYSKQL